MPRPKTESPSTRYPLPIRCLHWLRAILVLGLIVSGWYMTGLPESDMATSSFLYPNHKQFGVLVWLLAGCGASRASLACEDGETLRHNHFHSEKFT